jgi:choline kinase
MRGSEAVILMAGSGSRLRGSDETFLKPFVPVLGRPLICYTIDALIHAGIKKAIFIVGYQSSRMIAAAKQLIPSELEPCFIENPDWEKQNGVSVLAAAGSVTPPFLLTMSDHLFDQAVIDILLADSALNELNVAIDRKLDSIFDLEDAMKVRLHHDRVIEIGKNLKNYNAIDTGVFVCPAEIFGYLESARKNGDVSLADGARLMAEDGKTRAIDIGDAWWQDVDTVPMLRQAEARMADRLQLK